MEKDEIVYAQYRKPVIDEPKLFLTLQQRHVPVENLGNGSRRAKVMRPREWFRE